MANGSAVKNKIFDVELEVAGRSVGKLRNEIVVRVIEPFQSENSMATDEGEFQGGEGTAPTPLEYLAVGLIGCLMTQLRVFSRKMKVPIRDVSVTARLNWAGIKSEDDYAGQPYSAAPVSFDLDIDFDSDASNVDLARLLDAAQKGCFVEQTIAQVNTVKHRFRSGGGQWNQV